MSVGRAWRRGPSVAVGAYGSGPCVGRAWTEHVPSVCRARADFNRYKHVIVASVASSGLRAECARGRLAPPN